MRRCVDLVELLSAAASGMAQAVLASADLRGLDRESLAQLAGAGLATVGLADPDVEERLLHQLGVDVVVAARASAEQVAGALLAAATARSHTATASVAHFVAGSAAAAPAGPAVAQEGPGVVVAVWGPAGAPGRTTLAIGLADALAVSGVQVLLIDADPYGGAVAILTGLLDESPGITAACRAANAGALDVARLAECCREVAPGLRVLAGISQPSRCTQLRPPSLELVIALSRWLADVVILDTGFSLEDDEELSYDTVAPRRNAATLTALGCAEQVVAVGSAEPLGLARLIRDLPFLATVLGSGVAELTASGRVLVAANRVRDGLASGDAQAGVREALRRHAGVDVAALLPMDLAAADAAHGRGRLLSEAAPGSPLRRSMRQLAELLRVPARRVPDAFDATRRGSLRRAREGRKQALAIRQRSSRSRG